MSEIQLKALAARLESSALAYEMLGEKQLPALLRVAAAALAPQWQPIESAPKDGTRILLFGDGDQVVAYFNVGYGTWDDGDHHDDIQGLTHWQPLPAPPEVEG